MNSEKQPPDEPYAGDAADLSAADGAASPPVEKPPLRAASVDAMNSMDSMESAAADSTHHGDFVAPPHKAPVSDQLLSPGYLSLLGTQFFGAANDNILKQCLTFMVATGIWSGSLAEGGLGDGGQVVPALLLTVPFIFLSGYAGQISDRYSKRTVMLWVKIAEIPIAMLAFVGFYIGNLWLTLFAMLLLSVQSSFFGPAKYGVIPELVHDRHLSMANGLINMLTNLAVIIGSLAAGPLSDLFNPEPVAGEQVEAVLWAPGAALIGVALAGLLVVLPLPRLEAANAKLKWDWNPFGSYIEAFRIMMQGPLMVVVLAWAGFYMVGMLALMILPDYQEILGIDYTRTSHLLGIMGIAIALGSVITGLISGREIRPTLIPVGAIGMTVCFGLLGVVTPSYWVVAALIGGAGFFAGFYIVPLQALIQYLSPDDERGRVIGTSNAISFCFSSAGPLVYWIAVQLGLKGAENRIFLICALLAGIGTAMGVVQLRRVMMNSANSQ
ncbi:MAG: MFS transporter [Planctomycetales bacterium]|nr:MFS transporter [Planctomycetales bacterium]